MSLPRLEYYATFRNDYYVAFCEEITRLRVEVCDFHLSTIEDISNNPRPARQDPA
jgi:hypothetical protein